MSEPIDWLEISRKIGQRKSALAALEQIIGEDVIRQAVDYYVALKPEYELARQVLWKLHPWSAMQRCYEIYQSSTNIQHRRDAIELLRVVADARALDWIDEFLADPDEGIQNWGIGVLDQLLYGGGIRNSEVAMEKAQQLLAAAEKHESLYVREKVEAIRVSLAMSETTEKAWSELTNSNIRSTG